MSVLFQVNSLSAELAQLGTSTGGSDTGAAESSEEMESMSQMLGILSQQLADAEEESNKLRSQQVTPSSCLLTICSFLIRLALFLSPSFLSLTSLVFSSSLSSSVLPSQPLFFEIRLVPVSRAVVLLLSFVLILLAVSASLFLLHPS